MWRRAGLGCGVALLALCPAALAAPRSTHAYVVDNTDNDVLQYSVASNGTLSAETPASVATGNGPVALALNPIAGSAYVADGNDDTISQYSVAGNGTLTPKNPATVVASAPGVSLSAIASSPDGRSVYAAGYNAVFQYSVGWNGKLSPKTPAVVDVYPADPNSYASVQDIVLSANGRSAYVLSTGSGIGSAGAVYQYNVEWNGTLEPKTPASIPTGPVPLAIALGANGKSLYVTNSDAGSYDGGVGSISQYAIGANGTLTPDVPASVATGSNIYDPNSFPRNIAVNPDGQSALVLTSGAILRYTIAPNGTLNSSPISLPFAAFPLDAGATVSDAYSADGKYAYVTNQGGGFVAGSGYAVGSDGPAVVSQYAHADSASMGLSTPSEVLTAVPFTTVPFPYEIVLNGQ